MTPEEFEAKVRAEAEEHGVEVRVSEDDHVLMKYGDVEQKVNGFFDHKFGDEKKPVIAWNTGRPFEQWFPVLVHEYNHMRQWIEQDPRWLRLDRVTDFFQWLEGNVELALPQLKNSMQAYSLVELDCDKRTTRMIRELELPLDADRYAQTANAYVWFYFWAGFNRSWYQVGHEPYNTDAIVDAMPIWLPEEGEYTDVIYKREYERLYDRHMVHPDQNTLFTE
jgi:hypothetical protein